MSNPNMTPEEAWHEIVNLFYDLSMPCPDGVSMIDHGQHCGMATPGSHGRS